MIVPEELKLEPNMAVVFKKYFRFEGHNYNAIVQESDGTLVFFDTEVYHTNATIKVAYCDIKGDK